MLKAAAFAVSLSLIGGSASATGSEKAPKCWAFDVSDLGKEYSATKVTPGQYNFLIGMWAASPQLPGAFPPGDGASILRKDHKDDGAVVMWTKGKLVCLVLPAPDNLLKIMKGIKTHQLDDDGNEI